MNTKTNIFYYAPKELSTDAFLTWILYFLDSSDKYYKEKQFFFDTLILKPEDRGKEISDVSVSKQKNNVDVLLRFKIKADDREFCVLFEDKTWSTYHISGKKGVNNWKNIRQFIRIATAIYISSLPIWIIMKGVWFLKKRDMRFLPRMKCSKHCLR